jgi:hypothetical protein
MKQLGKIKQNFKFIYLFIVKKDSDLFLEGEYCYWPKDDGKDDGRM